MELPATFGRYFLTESPDMAEIYLAKIVGPGGFEKQLVIKQIHRRVLQDAEAHRQISSTMTPGSSARRSSGSEVSTGQP